VQIASQRTIGENQRIGQEGDTCGGLQREKAAQGQGVLLEGGICVCVYVCVCVCVCINYSYNHEIYDAVLVSLSSRQHQVYQNCVLKVVLCGSTLLCVCVCGWVGGCGCRVAVDHISSANIHIHRCSAQRESARERERTVPQPRYKCQRRRCLW
jgi:hypothetical protein